MACESAQAQQKKYTMHAEKFIWILSNDANMFASISIHE